MAELTFFTGTMDCGKSTLALQVDHNHRSRGRAGRIFSSHDRAGDSLLSSRLGLTIDAIEVGTDFNFWRYVVDSLTSGGRIDYLICDEAQFYT
ncbi:MAG: thymidine kinase, partial [Nocardioidaceae bacterium]